MVSAPIKIPTRPLPYRAHGCFYAGAHDWSAVDLVSVFPTESNFKKLERSSMFFSTSSMFKDPVDFRQKTKEKWVQWRTHICNDR